MKKTRFAFVLACACLWAASGCRNRGNDNDEVPADVQKAVDDVAVQLEATAEALGGAVEGFASVDLDDSSSNDCPEVILLRQDNITTLALTFEPGCESEYYDSVSGSVSVVFDRNEDSFQAVFEDFTVDGETTDGELSVQRTEDADLRTWMGTIDIATSGVGSVVGDVIIQINPVAQIITIESASLVLTNADGESQSVEIEGIVIRPVANGNFVPEDGTITFEVPNDDPEGPDSITIIIEYDINSPHDGTVRLTFGEGTVDDYELPGF